jgi:cytosolic carboxypeptidase protein 2/3
LAVYRKVDYSYDLILQNDINTRGYSQWFFFSVSNKVKGETYKFNIVNMVKNNQIFLIKLDDIRYKKNNF